MDTVTPAGTDGYTLRVNENEKWKVQWFKVRSKTDLEPA